MRLTKLTLFFFVSAIFVFLLALPSWSYQEESVANGGTVKGKVVYNGYVPMRKIVPTKDSAVCGGIRDEPQIIVGNNKGVKDAVVYLKEIKKGKKWNKTKKRAELDNIECKFKPYVQAVPVGSKIVITNSDPVLHNTHGFIEKATVFNVALPIKDMKINRPLRKAGMVRVDCDVHGWMRAWVYVADNPYFAISDNKGSFSIRDIPPGDYTLVTWHEYTGIIETPISIKAKETTAVNIEIKR